MRPHLADDDLTPELVPSADAPIAELVRFGHSYHAYKIAGSVQRVATIAVEVHDEWSAHGTLPTSLSRLRLALFHSVRAIGRGAAPADDDVDDDAEAWLRALVAAVRRAVDAG